MPIQKKLLKNPFTRLRYPMNADGRSSEPELLPFRGNRSKKQKTFKGSDGKDVVSNSVIVPRDNGLDIIISDRIFEGHFETGTAQARSFEIVGFDTGVVPGKSSTHHEQIYLK